MKTISPLSPSEQSAQIATFIDFFVKEFMSEVWYLEESARGNIPGREEASMGSLFNVACGLASLVPIPGSVIAMVASQKLIVASMKLASGLAEAARDSEWASRALAVAEVVKSTWDGYGEHTDDIALSGKGVESAGLDEGQAVDTVSLSVLARWLGHQLAQRYEQALTERLSTEPEAAILGLARVGARRSLAFLAENGGMTGSPQERTERLLAGVVQGKPMSWYERPLKWFAKGERLAGRDGLAKEKFTAERLYVNGVWTSLTGAGIVCHTHSRTEWFSVKTCTGQPKYGYVSGHIEEPELKTYEGETPDFSEWLTRRVYQPATLEQLGAYLSSPVVLAARGERSTAAQSLNDFLSENFEAFPKHGQAVFHGDLTALDLSSGNFSGSDLSGSQITGDLSYSRFDGALLYATQWHKVMSAAGSQVSFARAQLGFSEMAGANFQGDVDVTQADLSCVNLTGATFGAVQQVGTKWYKANLTGVEYEGIAKAQREQLVLVTAQQTAQSERFKALNDKVAALEAQVKPLLEGLAAKQPVGAGAGAGGSVPEAQRQTQQQQQALEELLAAQEKRIQFESYCEEKLAQLTGDSESHTGQIVTLESNLERVKEASAEGQAALQSQIDQLSERVDRVEESVEGLARRSSVIKLKVDDLTAQLSQMHLLLEEQRGLTISNDLSLADREAILEKSAIGKVLAVYCSNLSQRQKDLHYYVRPDVIERIPDRKTPGEYMLSLEKGMYEDATKPLLEEVDDFLQSSAEVMVLLGEPGAGKSLFAWYSTQSRFQHYQMVLQDREPSETPWLPVVIELKNYRLSELTGLLPRYLKTVCELSTDELIAIQNDRKPAHKLLIVLDGFDELKQDAAYTKHLVTDLYEACGAQSWYAGQVKLVVTCRVRELPDSYLEKQYFGHGFSKIYRRRILLPFSQDKISDYLDERTKAGASRGLELLSAQEYLDALKASSSLKEMVRNPFVLRLFVEALPGLIKEGINLQHIQRYDIYHGFVKQWFQREVNRLDVAHRRALGVDASGANQVAASFERYAGILAMEMYRLNTLIVSYDEAKQEDPAFEVWSKMDEVVAETDLDEAAVRTKLAQRFQRLKASDKRRLAVKENIKTETDYVDKYIDLELFNAADTVTAQLEAFKMTSPLRQTGDQYSFIHKSFYEYFIASRLIGSATSEKPLTERVSTVLAIFAPTEEHKARRIWQEPEAIDFVCEYWQKSTPGEKSRLKETWFEVIETTKRYPENGVAGANAGTLLNWVNVNFIEKDWRGVHMPGVDLRRAYLEGSDLRGANLSGAWLGQVQAKNADLREANLARTEFSQRPSVRLEGVCSSVAYHPSLPIVAAAYGIEIRQYHFGENRWLGAALSGHTNEVTCVSYSPDGCFLASGSSDFTVRQWHAVSGEPRGAPLTGHTGHVYCVSYSGDGLYLASGSKDKTIRQWHAASGEQKGAPLTGHTDRVTSISYSSDGCFLASGSWDWTIRQWEAESGEPRGEPLSGHAEGIYSVSYSPDGCFLASGSYDRAIRQWHAATGEQRGAPLLGHTGIIHSVRYSADGLYLASGSSDKTIRQWYAASGEQRGAPLTGHTRDVISVSYSEDGRFLASGSWDCTIRQWEAESGGLRGAPPSGHTGSVYCVTYSADGMYLASASGDNTIRQWHTVSGEQRGSPLVGHTGGVIKVSYSRDGHYLASGSYDNTIRQWHAGTGELRGAPLTGHISYVTSISYSADGMYLASGSEDKTIRQWSARSGALRNAPLRGHTDKVTCVSYSPDGRFLASGSGDKTIRQWHAASGQLRGAPLTGHTADIASVKYSPDGSFIVCGGSDSTTRQWHAATGQFRGAPLTHAPSIVNNGSYSDDGLYLAACGGDGTVRLWQRADSHTGARAADAAGSFRSRESRTDAWRLSWGTKSSQMQLSTQGIRLAGAIGLEPHQIELLRQHGYEGSVNPATGQIEDDNSPPDEVLSPDDGDSGSVTLTETVEVSPAVEEVASAPVESSFLPLSTPERVEGAASAAPVVDASQPAAAQAEVASGGAEPSAASPSGAASVMQSVVAVARRGSELLLSLAPVLKRARIFSPSHKLRDALVPIYRNPDNVDSTYVSEDMLRSAELGLTEKQCCKFARVNLNAACESSSDKQVKDAVDLFEAVVGKRQAEVNGKVMRVVGAKKQEKYFACLLHGRARLAELSVGAGTGAGASAGVIASK